MARKLTSFLPQLSIAVPIVTTGLLIFQEIPDPITSLLSKTSDEQKEEGEKSKEGKEGAKGDKKGEDGKGQGKQEGDGKGDSDSTAQKGEQGSGGSGEGKGQSPVDGIKTLELGGGTSGSSGTDTTNSLGSEGVLGSDVLKSAEGLLNTLKQGVPEAGQDTVQGLQTGQQGESGDSTDATGRDNSSGDGNHSQDSVNSDLNVGAGNGEETHETTGVASTGGGRGWASAFSGFWGGELTEEFIG